MSIFSTIIRFCVVTFVFLSFPTPSFAQEVVNASKFEKELKVGKDTVSIFIASIPINPKEVDISAIESCKILPCLGGFQADLTERIDHFNVIWNGKPLHIPRTLYEDCFTPALKEVRGLWDISNDYGGILVLSGADKESILIMMQAWRAACCGYTIWWVIRKDGNHTRYLDDTIP